MALRLPQSPPISALSPPPTVATTTSHHILSFSLSSAFHPLHLPSLRRASRNGRRRSRSSVFAGGEDAELVATSTTTTQEEEVDETDPDPQDLEYVAQIKRVIDLLKENRDMLFSEVKLTIMIEDPRDVERRRLLGIDDSEGPTREELAEMLEEINEGKIPTDRAALQMLYEEMIQWPNLEVKAETKGRKKSLYAKATDTGVDPQVAAKRLNIDWDSAAEIEETASSKEDDVPKPLGYAVLYLVTAFPVIIVNAEADGAYSKVGVTMTTVQSLNQSDFLILEKSSKTLIKESQQKERQISVDPLSMNESGSPSSPLPPTPNSPTPNGMFQHLPPLVPTKYKFLSNSLPNSANSSPKFNPAFMKSKGRNQNQVSSPLNSSLAQQHSVALTRLAHLREKHLQRSKSCGEGRASAPNDDFDIWLTKVNSTGQSPRQNSTSCAAESNKMYTQSKSGKNTYKSYDENFKCGALCIFLPGFGKGKPVRARKNESESESEHEFEPDMAHVISRGVSLEKFECGSWTSSAIINDHDEESSNLFFDLPMELIRTSVNDASSPVSSAFVFDKDLKGVLKNGTSKGAGGGGKSGESSRHVRFSSSSPTAYPSSPSFTPRLRMAREEFNAFIDAQSA